MTIQDWMIPAILACFASYAATLALIVVLRRKAILDLPNDRSLHDIPKPRGGGWAVLIGLGVGLLASDSLEVTGSEARIIIAVGILAVVSWMDDRQSLPALPRFGAQIVAVALGVSTLKGHVFQGLLPPIADRTLTGFCWLWFVNLFNFMDGMDGLASGEAFAVTYGLFLLQPHPVTAIILAASIMGFLVWNWGPSKIMLGDVGSIPIGYLVGLLLLRTAEPGGAMNSWAAALLLPLYFYFDATFTICKRALRGQKIWQAHRQHFYQQAVLAGRTHRQVAIAVYGLNALLVFCAVMLSPHYPVRAVIIGFLAVCLMAIWMRSKPREVAL